MGKQNTPQILIVDDNVNNIKLAASTLRENNYNISFAQNGYAALEYVQKYHYDLILLDIMMPEMSGFDVCERLKSNETTRDIPIIFLTAKTDAESVSKGFQLGGVDYIMKPFNNSELLARVRNHLLLKRQKDELVELVATKDKFFSIIAHDLKNPFYQMLSLGNLLESSISAHDFQQAKKIGGLISKSAQDGYRLLENLLQWSRTQTGRITFEPVELNLHQAAEAVISIYGEALKHKSITLQNDIDENIRVTTDPNMLSTVFRNLIGNSIKFTPEKGYILLNSFTDNGFVNIEVTDTGTGIEEEDIPRLFRIDASFSQPGTNNEEGTGLGLILCKEFVEQMGGTISVESEYGKGTTFTFTLPSPS